MKFNAPENCNSCNVGGEEFVVDKDGFITVPDAGDYTALLVPHGFTPIAAEPDTPEQTAAKLAEVAIADKAAADALAAEQVAKEEADAAAAATAAKKK
jgi:hypothetical protein